MDERNFKMEMNKNGQRILVVHYTGKGWDLAIDAALDACGRELSEAQRRAVSIIALPAGCAWGSGS